MKYYLGIDCSKYKVHIAVLNEASELVKLDVISSIEKKDIERMWELKNKFEDWIIDFTNNINDLIVEDLVVIVEEIDWDNYSKDILGKIAINLVCIELSVPIKNKTIKLLRDYPEKCKKEYIKAFCLAKEKDIK